MTSIEAGCTFTGLDLKGDPGATFAVSCPANCESGGSIWGSDIYTRDSAVCRAGIHAGAIPPTGGVVTVRLEPGRPAYRGTARHGIQSGDFASFGGSYAVLGGDGQTASVAPGVLEVGCSFIAQSLVGEIGSRHVVNCPAGCMGKPGTLWGTDVYTAESSLCRAAIHAGLITDNTGGTFAVILGGSQPSYRGTTRNGLQSGDHPQFARSFQVSKQ